MNIIKTILTRKVKELTITQSSQERAERSISLLLKKLSKRRKRLNHPKARSFKSFYRSMKAQVTALSTVNSLLKLIVFPGIKIIRNTMSTSLTLLGKELMKSSTALKMNFSFLMVLTLTISIKGVLVSAIYWLLCQLVQNFHIDSKNASISKEETSMVSIQSHSTSMVSLLK